MPKSGESISEIISVSIDAHYELAPAKPSPPGRAEADPYPWPGPDGERAGAEPSRAPGDDQSGNDREPGAGGIVRGKRYSRRLQRRNLPESGNRKNSRGRAPQSLRGFRCRLVFQP